MKDTSKIFYFLVACLYVLGVIGGNAYLFYDRHYLFGFTGLMISGMAFPVFRKVVKKLME